MKNPLAAQGIADCWNHIGAFGDCSCPELRRVFHCKNCSVYTSAGRSLLEREPSADYMEEWKIALSQPREPEATGLTSVVIFRIREKLFALETKYFREVTELRTIRKIPHRPGRILKGLINIRGEILLCASFSQLFEMEELDNSSLKRMIVIEKDGQRWAFNVDQVEGVFHLLPPAANSVIVRPVQWERTEIDYLDAEILFERLKKEAL